jgi:hypothetical protein
MCKHFSYINSVIKYTSITIVFDPITKQQGSKRKEMKDKNVPIWYWLVSVLLENIIIRLVSSLYSLL